MGNKNEIVKTEQEVAELAEMQAAVLAEMADEGFAGFDFQPERIKLGAGGMLAYQTAAGEVMPAPLDVIVAMAQKARLFYPTKDGGGNVPPLCSSKDSVTGWFDAESPLVAEALKLETRHPALDTVDKEAAAGPWACSECPLSQFGTGPFGSMACKVVRKLVVLPLGWAAPAILTLPPTSVKVWDAFASGRKTRGHSYFDTRVSLGLTQAVSKSGKAYATLTIGIGEPLPSPVLAEVIQVRRQYEDLVRKMDLSPEDYDTTSATVTPVTPDIDTEIPF